MSNIGTTYNIFQPSVKCLQCRYWEPASKNFMGLLLAVSVDLTTAKTHDQKGEIERNDFICGSWKYIL